MLIVEDFTKQQIMELTKYKASAGNKINVAKVWL